MKERIYNHGNFRTIILPFANVAYCGYFEFNVLFFPKVFNNSQHAVDTLIQLTNTNLIVMSESFLTD